MFTSIHQVKLVTLQNDKLDIIRKITKIFNDDRTYSRDKDGYWVFILPLPD